MKWNYDSWESILAAKCLSEKCIVRLKHCWVCEGVLFAVCSKSRVCCLRRETLKSPWVCGSGCFGEKRECLQKMLPCEEVARYRGGILHHSRHSQFWGWRKVAPVCGVLNFSNSYSTGNPWSKRNRRQGSMN